MNKPPNHEAQVQIRKTRAKKITIYFLTDVPRIYTNGIPALVVLISPNTEYFAITSPIIRVLYPSKKNSGLYELDTVRNMKTLEELEPILIKEAISYFETADRTAKMFPKIRQYMRMEEEDF